MKQPLALFDVDKTLYDGISYFPLLETQVEGGLISTEVLSRARDYLQEYATGRLPYEDFVRSLLDIYAEGLTGRPVDEVTDSTDTFFDQTDDFFDYAKPTVDTLRDTHELALVTGGTQFTAAAVARVLGIEKIVSSVMGVEDGRITGEMDSYLATRHEKRRAIHHLTDVHPFGNSMGFGDSEGDIEMLRAVNHAICIQPTPGLHEIASQEGWLIVDSPDELASAAGLWVVKHTLEAS